MDLTSLTHRKNELDQLILQNPDIQQELDNWIKVELAYTSNAIEDNELSRDEVQVILNQGLAIGGKSMKQHLEVVNHANAYHWIKSKIKHNYPIELAEDVKKLHKILLRGILEAKLGHYRTKNIEQENLANKYPHHLKVDYLMQDFSKWMKLDHKLHPIELAMEVHYKLLQIQPFMNCNGQIARLMMNMILMMHNYPVAIIKKRDTAHYNAAIEKAILTRDKQDYLEFISGVVSATLDTYLEKVSPNQAMLIDAGETLLKIGQLAKAVGENNSTIRHWTKWGLLEIAEITPGGYQMYSSQMLKRIEEIHQLKKQRYTLKEIQQKLT